jgi:hypothetical protein
VDNLPSRFNRQKEGEQLWTLYGRRRLAPRTAIQSYVIARHNRTVVGETGAIGSGAVYAWQTEVDAPTPLRWLNWTAESVVERGHYSTDDVRAWGMFLRAEATLSRNSAIDVRYAATSGDSARGDGVRGQYDTFYAAANYFGGLGQFRGTNIKSLSIGGNWAAARQLNFFWRYFNTHMNDTRDVWYGAVTPNLSRPSATSSFLGHEADMLLLYQVTKKLQVRTGYYRFFPGGYLSTGAHHGASELRLQVIGGI